MNVRLMHTMRFNAGVHYKDSMQINEYTLRVWMTTNSTDPKNHNIAYKRLKYFVYHELESTIFINQDEIEQCHLYLAAGLDLCTMPDDPVDQIIGIMLYHKLNAIMEDRMIIQETEISSSMGDDMVYLHSENENTSIIEPPNWWNSADPIHCSFESVDQDILSLPGTIWRNLDLDWPDYDDESENGNVVFADFKKEDDTK